MASLHLPSNLLLSILSLILLFNSTSVTAWKSSAFPSPLPVPQTTSYIVQTLNTSRPAHFATQAEWYSSLIETMPRVSNANVTVPQPRIFYIYETALHGFAATLTPEEAQIISENDGVVAVYEDKMIELQTTHTPDFIGLNADYGIWQDADQGDDVIIGLLDTGIWPESQSFSDLGLTPVGPGWRGQCETGTRFNSSMCNNKLIGARFLTSGAEVMGVGVGADDFNSPRDRSGHGTHTSSTAAGSATYGASFFGKAYGTARGMAPNARIAMYKVCWGLGCAESDILAGFEKAIEDGVQIISVSIGPGAPIPYYNDVIAKGAFAAERNGIFVACAAGNSGPRLSTVTNSAPWITSVAAGSIDRTFEANITLASGEVFFGESLYFEVVSGMQMLPIVSFSNCYSDSLVVPSVVMGKIVVCDDADINVGFFIEAAGGAALISINNYYSLLGETIVDVSYTLPSLSLGYTEGRKLRAYLNSAANPEARLQFDGQTVIGKRRAPEVASFSSRGPNYLMPGLLKPDILAPGNNILAAWPSETPVSFSDMDPRRSDFNILSGTSMACPHVAGTAALLLHLHPRWSPAMIRSAIITTALVLDNRDRPIIEKNLSKDATPLAFGAGHINPQAANDPGLVYDTSFEDYVNWLCKLNYTSKQMGSFVPWPVNCSDVNANPNWDLNYPSFAVAFQNEIGHRVVRSRVLTKVWQLPENYTARVVNLAPEKVAVKVTPERLEFVGPNEKRSYTVEFTSKVATNATGTCVYEFAYVIWENEEHQVKSPVLFMWN